MAVDISPAAPAFLPITSLTTSIGKYDVVGVLPPEATGVALRVRNCDSAALAELRFLPGPAPGETNVEKLAVWRQSVAGWNRALKAVTDLGAHPYIQHILEFGEMDGGYYALLDLVEGRTLRQTLQEEGPRPLEWLLPLCSQLAAALDFTAAHQIFHGHLSLDNIVLSGSPPRICLRGLGLDCLQRQAVTLFTAPEQAARLCADARVDIYALGALLYTCLSGHPPFAASSREELCRKIQTTPPAPLLNQPEWTRAIIARAMQRVPEHRYRVAVDIVNDLTYRRSPAPLKDAAIDPSYDNDCSLGRYMPEMALKENKPQPLVREETRATAKLMPWLWQRLHLDAPAGTTRQLLARLNPLSRRLAEEDVPDPFPDLPAEGEAPSDAGKPVARGFLGRFNRYMALQDYVFLAPDDPTRRGWRGLLRRMGLYHPAPNAHIPARRRWQLAPRLAKRLEVAWRRTRRVAALSLALLAIHAQKLIGEQERATVANVNGQASVILPDGLELALQEQATLAGDDHPILITHRGSATLTLSDSKLRLAPNTRVQIGQMTYKGARILHLDLLEGGVDVEVDPQETTTGHYEVVSNGIEARAVPSGDAASGNESVHFVVEAQANSVQVLALQGKVRVYSSPYKRLLNAGKQLTATKDKPLQKPTRIDAETLTSLLAQHRTDGEKSGLIGSLAATMRHLYMSAQEKWFMPSLDKGLAFLQLRPGSPLDEVSRGITARASLKSISTVMTGSELPEKIDYKTLEGVDMDLTGRLKQLENLDGHRLLAYRPLGAGSYIILARVDNDAKTLLKLKDNEVSVVPEDKEEEAFAEANAQ